MNFKTDKCHLLISSYKHEVKVGEDKNLGKKLLNYYVLQ